MVNLIERFSQRLTENQPRRVRLAAVAAALVVAVSAVAFYFAGAAATSTSINEARIQGWVSSLKQDRLTAERQNAQRNLEMSGEAAVPSLVVALRSDNPILRRNAADMLGYIASPRATDALRATLKNDPVPAVRRNAAWVLGEIKDMRALSDLQQAAVADRNQLVRATAADSLARMRTILAKSAGVNEQTIGAFTTAPSQSNLVYLTAKRDLLVSRDGGKTWESLTNVLPTQFTALSVNPNNLAQLYAGAEGMGLYKSDNGGQTWYAINNGIELTPGARTATSAIAIDPSNPQVIFIAQGVWLGTGRVQFEPLGLLYSRDGGMTWQALTTGMINEEITRLAFRDGQLYGLAGDRVLTLVTPR